MSKIFVAVFFTFIIVLVLKSFIPSKGTQDCVFKNNIVVNGTIELKGGK